MDGLEFDGIGPGAELEELLQVANGEDDVVVDELLLEFDLAFQDLLRDGVIEGIEAVFGGFLGLGGDDLDPGFRGFLQSGGLGVFAVGVFGRGGFQRLLRGLRPGSGLFLFRGFTHFVKASSSSSAFWIRAETIFGISTFGAPG